jgi:hypothetical protein
MVFSMTNKLDYGKKEAVGPKDDGKKKTNELKGRELLGDIGPKGYMEIYPSSVSRQFFSDMLSKGGKPAIVRGIEITYEGSDQDGNALISISIGGEKLRDGLPCPPGIRSEFDIRELGVRISVSPEKAWDSACIMTITSATSPLMAP